MVWSTVQVFNIHIFKIILCQKITQPRKDITLLFRVVRQYYNWFDGFYILWYILCILCLQNQHFCIYGACVRFNYSSVVKMTISSHNAPTVLQCIQNVNQSLLKTISSLYWFSSKWITLDLLCLAVFFSLTVRDADLRLLICTVWGVHEVGGVFFSSSWKLVGRWNHKWVHFFALKHPLCLLSRI